MCRNGQFTERGILRRDGYGVDRWRVEPEFAVAIPAGLGELGVLLEPASVLAKAWEQVDRISGRAFFLRSRALVTGPGPNGIWSRPGAHYHAGDAGHRRRCGPHHRAHRARRCRKVRGWNARQRRDHVPHRHHEVRPDARYRRHGHEPGDGATKPGQFGTVNAGRRHWEAAAASLAAADLAWLGGLITRRSPSCGGPRP